VRVVASMPDGYAALRTGVGAYRLPLDVVRVSGPEATAYLQGQLSQDVAPLGVGGAAPSLLLEPDGKLTALVRVTRVSDDAYVLDTDAGFGELVAARLKRFKLRTKVEIAGAAWSCVALRGGAVRQVAPRANAPFALGVDWGGVRGIDLLGPDARAVDAEVPPDALWCDPATWEAVRVEAGIPKMGTELDARTIAAEAGLVERTVSFTKGCYTGQELVARLDARGSRVARRLSGVVALDAGPEEVDLVVGAPLWTPEGDKVVGRCTSASWSPGLGMVAALAYLHRSVEVPAALVWASDDAASPGSRRPAHARPLPLVGQNA
jgi:tRNA-modifying protein YgfZ